MPDYRRMKVQGGTYFFTVNCAERHNQSLLTDHISSLRKIFRNVKHHHPFKIDAIVVLPEHLHCIWTLPPGDMDFKTRWALIKAGFSREIPATEARSLSRMKRGERGIWQRRYWEHLIRDERDLRHHIDYIHWNPVKHGWVSRVCDWPYSSFHRYVKRGVYPENWAWFDNNDINLGE
ncbi:transposase [Amphritea sp. 2_MG-2023]|uniref:REP-associated tyrosine transposase n=1 Tax=Amphritea TaxID=515417 RepID=UPI001C067974|nr:MULTISPECIES: transposase [Amphritea]MBU2964839.1 transposase [Amphritea atlantica]MDO6419586.1 transposase [Amphritea sp. 2_MG-2023]